MIFKFNKFERIAGLFVVGAILGSIISTVAIGVKRGWFERHIPLVAVFETAEGIHAGTDVKVAGLNAGKVDQVDLMPDNTIRVELLVSSRFFSRLRQDSKVQIIRPFIIGEKVLDISVGSKDEKPLQARQVIPSVESFDIMDLVSGKKLGPLFTSMGKLADTMSLLMEAFADKDRTKNLIAAFDEVRPMMVNVNKMSREIIVLSRQMTRKKNLQQVMANLAIMTEEMNRIMPELANTEAIKDIGVIVENLALLTSEMQKLVPALNEIAPDLPQTSRRAIEALNELVITLKAMQKSFLLSGNVDEVKEEEAKARAARKKKAKRKPAEAEKKE